MDRFPFFNELLKRKMAAYNKKYGDKPFFDEEAPPSRKPQRRIPKKCPHCGEIGCYNMNRYHFDNCPYKPENFTHF